jgi:hypothetical protein
MQLHFASMSQRRSAQGALPVTQSLHVGLLIAFLRLAQPDPCQKKTPDAARLLRIRQPLTSLRHARK